MVPPAAAAPSPPLDSTVLVATPENVTFDFRLAGPFSRTLALLIDVVVIGVVFVILVFLLGILGTAGIGLLLFILFLMWWGYGGLMEAFWNGQTLGKKAVGIRVVSETGLAINAGQAMLRNVLRSADLVPPFFPGVVAMLFGSRFQRLGDLAAGTMVVLDGQRSSPRPPMAGNVTDRMRQRIPPRFRPDAALIDALAAYVGRRADLSPARRIELSLILARHFIRAWSLPPKINPDHLLCAIYEYATMDEQTQKMEEQHRTTDRAIEIEDVDEVDDAVVLDYQHFLERISHEGR
jgi:uncharacterized RDD family membrane protein YckC